MFETITQLPDAAKIILAVTLGLTPMGLGALGVFYLLKRERHRTTTTPERFYHDAGLRTPAPPHAPDTEALENTPITIDLEAHHDKHR